MSFDFEIVEHTEPPRCECCGRRRQAARIDLGSPTYNLTPIFALAAGVDDFRKAVEQPLVLALEVFARMCASFDASDRDVELRQCFLSLEPPDGWGDLGGARRVSSKTKEAIEDVIDQGGITLIEWADVQAQPDYERDEPVTMRKVPIADLVFRI